MLIAGKTRNMMGLQLVAQYSSNSFSFPSQRVVINIETASLIMIMSQQNPKKAVTQRYKYRFPPFLFIFLLPPFLVYFVFTSFTTSSTLVVKMELVRHTVHVHSPVTITTNERNKKQID
jgi:hypothetical protein